MDTNILFCHILHQNPIKSKKKSSCDNTFLFPSVEEVLLGYHGTELYQFIEDSLGTEILHMSVAMAMELYNISEEVRQESTAPLGDANTKTMSEK